MEAFHAAADLAVRLKREKRAGWLHRGLASDECESVADHSFGVAYLTMVVLELLDHDLDEAKCLKLALLHDIAEAEVGDITPNDPRAGEKSRLESAAIDATLARHVELAPFASLWQEYADRSSPEARLVKEMDQLELILMAVHHAEQHRLDTEGMIDRARSRISSPLVRLLADAVCGS